MRTLSVGLVLSACVLALPPDRTIWKSVKPAEGAKAIKINVEGKPLTYYALDGDGVTVRVKGPTRLRAYVRAYFAKADPEKVEFGLKASMDGKDLDAEKISARRSKSSTYAENGDGSLPGSRDELTWDVPEGEHVFVVRTDRAAHGAFVRATTQKRSLKTEMTPVEFEKAVEEIFEERERTWYFAKKDKAIVLEVTGPTTLDVSAALNFDSSMRTTLTWHVEWLVDGAVAQEKEFKSSRSHVRSYPDEKSVVPGQQESFQLKVPDGRHRIEIRPKGEHSAAFRVLIPTKDLKK